MSNMELSVVVPVYNEEENLPELLRRTLAVLDTLQTSCELILVDDGSEDASARMIEEAAAANPSKVVAVILAANFGQHAAVTAGLEVSAGKYVITMDADLQNPPEEIPRLLAELRNGVDVVGTIREKRRDTLFRRLASKCVNLAMRSLCKGKTMQDYGCMLRGYSRHVVNSLLRCQEHRAFLPALAMSFARNTREITIAHAERAAGKSKYSFRKLVSLQYDLLTSTGIVPLRCLTLLGFLIACFGLCLGICVFLRFLLDNTWGNYGIFALFAIQFVFTGGIFAVLGLLGEYIGRIHLNTMARPRYVIEKIVKNTDHSGN